MALQQGFTSDERFPVLETKNSSMTSSCGGPTFASMIELTGKGATNYARLPST